MIPDYYEFCNSTKIVSGTRAIEHIGYELAALGASQPLVLTSAERRELKVATIVIDALAGDAPGLERALAAAIPNATQVEALLEQRAGFEK